jgi:hypothetical protein
MQHQIQLQKQWGNWGQRVMVVTWLLGKKGLARRVSRQLASFAGLAII